MAHTSLASLFSDIAAAIRAKSGGTAQIVADDFPDAIAAIPTGTVAVATATRSHARSIQFSVAGEPKAFALQSTAERTLGSSTAFEVVCAVSDGATLTYSCAGTSNQVYYYTDGSLTAAYAGGTLTLTTLAARPWKANASYKLVYIY